QPGQESVRVGVLRLPERSIEMAAELEDDRSGLRDVAVAESRCGHREGVLVDDLLLEVRSIFLGPPAPGSTDTSHHGELHRPAASRIVTIHQEYRRTLRNHDYPSGFLNVVEASLEAGETHLSGMKISLEDAGLETKV